MHSVSPHGKHLFYRFMQNITAPKIPEGDKVDFDVSNMKFKLHHFLYSEWNIMASRLLHWIL